MTKASIKSDGQKRSQQEQSISKTENLLKAKLNKKKGKHITHSKWMVRLIPMTLLIAVVAVTVGLTPERMDLSLDHWLETIEWGRRNFTELRNDVHALNLYKKAFAFRLYEPDWLPQHVERMALVGLSISTIAGYIGYQDEQLQSLEEVMAFYPLHPLANFRYVDMHEKSMNKKKRFWTDQDIDRVASILQDSNLDPTDECRVHKTLSLMQKHRGDHRQAYYHMRDANKCKNALNPASMANFPQQLKHRWYESEKVCNNPLEMAKKYPDVPVFDPSDKSKQVNTYEILTFMTFPRSGSTLLESRLGRHSQIGTVGEAAILLQAMDQTNSLDIKTIKTKMYEIVPTLLSDSRPVSDLKFVIEKTVLELNMVLYWQVLPNSRSLILRRSPLDIIWSVWENHFENDSASWSTELQVIADLFVTFFNALNSCTKGFNTSGNSGYMKTVWYEDQIEDLEGSLREIIVDVLGLEWENTIMSGDVPWNTRFATASQLQVRRNVTSSRTARWRTHAPYILEQAELEGMDFEYLVQIVQNFSHPNSPKRTQEDVDFLRQAIAEYVS